MLALATPLIQAQGLECRRGERVLFRGLELELHAGEVAWLRGRNGSGKTSLLRLLAGLSTPAAGRIDLPGAEGGPSGEGDGSPSAQLLYIAHANALKEDLTATEALTFLATLGGARPAPAAVAQALARLGLAERVRAPVRTLSQGQRRRVALARLALPAPPLLWLLDEPYDALDQGGVAVLDGLLSEQVRRGGAVLLTSHQALSLDDPAPRVIDLDRWALSS